MQSIGNSIDDKAKLYIPKPDWITVGEFTFNGPMWNVWVPHIYLVFKARAGDAEARLVLDAFGMTLTDSNGKQVWPMVDTDGDVPILLDAR